MTSKKDLLDAQSFSRKRLLTAFVSGAPGGKELEPANPFRAVIAGVVLAVMVIIGGVFYGLVKPGLKTGWEEGTLVLVTDTGERFFTVAEELHPIINATSARLLSSGDSLSIVSTDSESLRDVPIRAAIGILGAPDDVPASADLIAEGWTACPVADGTAVSLPGLADAAATTGAVLAQADGHTYVVSGGLRYLVSPQNEAKVLSAIGLALETPRAVDSRWLNLFPEGSPLEAPAIAGIGGTAQGTNLPVGTLIPGDSPNPPYVVTANGELAPLTPLAFEILLNSPDSPGEVSAADATAALRLPIATGTTPVFPKDWPAEAFVAVPADVDVCAQLLHDGAEPATGLVTAETSELPAGVSIGRRSGALVDAGGTGAQATRILYIVDETGTAFPVPDAGADVLGRLGYAQQDIAPITTAWLAFFGAGPALTKEAAGRTPAAPATSAGAAENPASPSPTPSASPTPRLEGLATAAMECTAEESELSTDSPAAFNVLQRDLATARATGLGATVAIVDTGIDASHPQLTDAVIGGVNLVPDGTDARGFTDTVGHGTEVAGVIAAREVDGSGLTGLAPDASLLAVRVVGGTDDDAVKNGWGPNTERLADGIRWAADNGATIINVSMSVPQDEPVLRSAVAYAQSMGVLVVAASGNRASGADATTQLRYPAAYEGVLGTTAVDSVGQATAATYSGEAIAIAAPGQAVLTTRAGGGNCTAAGAAPATSYAAAYVSAAAALVQQAHPGDNAMQVAYRLTTTATRDNRDATGAAVGWGVVQPFDAIILVPGATERGPDNPFTGTVAVPVPPPSAEVGPAQVDDSVLAQRVALLVLAVLGAATFAVIGLLALKRRRADASAPQAEPAPGLLDRGSAELKLPAY